MCFIKLCVTKFRDKKVIEFPNKNAPNDGWMDSNNKKTFFCKTVAADAATTTATKKTFLQSNDFEKLLNESKELACKSLIALLSNSGKAFMCSCCCQLAKSSTTTTPK